MGEIVDVDPSVNALYEMPEGLAIVTMVVVPYLIEKQ
jgi:hypothetical protein